MSLDFIQTYLRKVNCSGYAVHVLFFVIGEDDLQRIITELNNVSNVQTLALNLGIRASALIKIMAEYPQQLETQKMHVLYHWLKRTEIIGSKRSQHPTWTRLAEAVARLDLTLSERIQRQYC